MVASSGRFVGKLGRKPPKHDPRTLQLANYVDHGLLPHVPRRHDWGQVVAPDGWGMMLNDKLGCCTCAAVGHSIMTWTVNAGQEVVLPDDDILHLYEQVSGYDPSTGANDNGAVELDVLNLWRSQGVAGHTIGAYVALEPKNREHTKISTFLFGVVYVGIALPKTIQNQDVWSVPPEGPTGDGAPGSLGGHAVPIIAYDDFGVTCVTWGRTQRVTWQFIAVYCEESYAVLSPDWFEGGKVAPSGFDIAALTEDLNEVASKNPPTPGPVAQH